MMAGSGDGPAETPLASKLKARIRREGPISVKAYVTACLSDEEHGYYRRMPAIGADGDFVTAPEISQVFGELIGLWCAVVWQGMGAPPALTLVELGPGRGTLMADALRAGQIVPGFREALRIRLVESNTALAGMQRAALVSHVAEIGAEITWHDSAADCAAALGASAHPFVMVANEFLDTCPADQLEMRDGRLAVRGVGLDHHGRLTFVSLPEHPLPREAEAYAGLREGDIVELQDFSFFAPFARLMRERPGAALFIDYGADTSGVADTLQGVRRHTSEPALASPGEADLSFQVAFGRFAASALAMGDTGALRLTVDGPVAQAELLGRLGIVERASRLMAANPMKAGAIETQVQRLLAPTGMGSRFLALGVRSETVAPLPGLDRAAARLSRVE